MTEFGDVACSEVNDPVCAGTFIQENVIEWIKGATIATVNFTKGGYTSRIRKLAEEHPDDCKIVVDNPNGTIVAHIPTKWIKIMPTKALSEEDRQWLSRMAKENLRSSRRKEDD